MNDWRTQVRTRDLRPVEAIPDPRTLIGYEPDTGQFYWIKPPTRVSNRGTPGTPNGKKINITVGGVTWPAARLAHFIMTGNIASRIRHINGDTRDLRWTNLEAQS